MAQWESSHPSTSLPSTSLPSKPSFVLNISEDYSPDVNNNNNDYNNDDDVNNNEENENNKEGLKWPAKNKPIRPQRKFIPMSSDSIITSPQTNSGGDWKPPTRRHNNSNHDLNLGFRKSNFNSCSLTTSSPLSSFTNYENNVNNNNEENNNEDNNNEGEIREGESLNPTTWSQPVIEKKNRRRFSFTQPQDIALVQEEVEKTLSQQNLNNNNNNNNIINNNNHHNDNQYKSMNEIYKSSSVPVESSVQQPKSKGEIEYDQFKLLAQSKDYSQLIALNILQYCGRDSLGRPIVMMLQANMAVKNIDLDLVLLYLITVLDPIVNSDYVLVFVASGVTKDNRPSLAWLKKAYSIFNRKYKKNLKTLYIVHPNIWIKMTLKLFRPFLSNKFWKKVAYIDDIADIFRTIDRSQITFPPFVIQYNKKLNTRKPVFGVPLEEVLLIEYSESGVPEVIEKCISYLRNCYEVEGIFRKSGGAAYIDEMKKCFNRGEDVDLSTVDDPHAVSGLFKTFLRDLPDPLLTFDLYDAFIQTQQAMAGEDAMTWVVTIRKLLLTLPPINQRITKIIFDLLKEFSLHSDVNLMTTANLSIVFAPNILKPRVENLLQVMQDTPVVNSLVKRMIEMSEYLWSS